MDRVRRCVCWRQSLAEHQLTHARIPRRYQHCQLTNFEQTVDSLREAHRRARAFVDAFPAVDKGLLLPSGRLPGTRGADYRTWVLSDPGIEAALGGFEPAAGWAPW